MTNKTFHIIDNKYPLSKTTSARIKKVLTTKGWKYNVKSHNYLFIVGGDGTLVRTLKKCYNKNIRVICINTGNVGFYASFTQKNIDKFENEILNTSNYIHPDILEIEINGKKIYAINEVVVQALNTIEMDIEISNNFYENFKGTGILICTKTGSTGQAKTNNGAIISPDINAIQLVEIAPTLHANKNTIKSPFVFSGNSTIKLSNFKFSQRTDVIADGMLWWHLKENNVIKIKKINSIFELFFSLNFDNYINKLHKTFVSSV